jgi:hypothetical protein
MRYSCVGIASLAAWVASCNGSGSSDDLGVARIALTGTPTDVACIGLTVAGARTITRLFAASPGMSQTFTVAGLPLGADVFTGQAFSQACGAVASSTVPDWLSDDVPSTLFAGAVTDVALVLRRNGRAQVTFGFEEDDAGSAGAGGTSGAGGTGGSAGGAPDGGAGASPCPAGQTLCSSGCVDLQTNISNCGQCDNDCTALACNSTSTFTCTSGVCHVHSTGICL